MYFLNLEDPQPKDIEDLHAAYTRDLVRKETSVAPERSEVGGGGQVDISSHVGWWRPQSNDSYRGTSSFSTFADGGSLIRRKSAACCFPHPHTCNERRDLHLISRPIPVAI
jgi:hypothetical protein